MDSAKETLIKEQPADNFITMGKGFSSNHAQRDLRVHLCSKVDGHVPVPIWIATALRYALWPDSFNQRFPDPPLQS